MSRIYKWGATTSIKYPNATHFAFVPAIIKVSGVPATKDVLQVTITDTQTGKQYSERREPFKGEARFDICRYLQIMFSDISHGVVDYSTAFTNSPLKKTALIVVGMCEGEQLPQDTIDFRIDALWGGISIGESSGGIMPRRWFVNYPFTLDLFTRTNEIINIQINDKGSEHIDDGYTDGGATSFRRRLVNPAHLLDVPSSAKLATISIFPSYILKDDVESNGLSLYTLTLDCSESGVYLRWIDHQGRYCYYLFKKTGTAFATSASATWERNPMTVPTAYVDGLNIGTPIQQSLSTKTTFSLGAKLVDSETFDFLLTATRSPIVDVFDGYDDAGVPTWHRVNIVAGNYSKTTKTLQDFILTIEQPAKSSQTL